MPPRTGMRTCFFWKALKKGTLRVLVDEAEPLVEVAVRSWSARPDIFTDMVGCYIVGGC